MIQSPSSISARRCAAFLIMALCVATQAARAGDYSVVVDGPLVGSMISTNRVSLGIDVDIDSTWEGLSDKEKATWRKFTDITDPKVTPPFPIPNIRGFLKKLRTPERFRNTDQITREDGVQLIVRIAAEGTVSQVEVITGTEKGSAKLSEAETVLAYIYGNAFLSTRFTPAKIDEKPVASAFAMKIRQVTTMR